MRNYVEEDFDFEDVPSKPQQKPSANKQSKSPPVDNEFFDFQQQDKNLKLPSLQSKNLNKSPQQPSNIKQDIFLQDIKGKNKFDPINSLQKSTKQKPLQHKPKEQLKVKQPIYNLPQDEDEYAQQEFEKQENYEDDFETEEKKTPIPFNSKNKNIKIEVGKPPSQKGKKELSSKKPIQVLKAPSRNSSRTLSRENKSQNISRQVEKSRVDPHSKKYSETVERSINEYSLSELQSFTVEKTTKQNDKIRNLIKKFNDELNELINKNINFLKNKKDQKVVEADDVIRVLIQQKTSHETALENSKRQLQKLKTKEGELKQQEYILIIDKNISESKTAISEVGKQINKLRHQMKQDGNKLAKFQKEETYGQQIVTVKNGLVNTKRQEQKNQQNLNKLDQKIQEFTKKTLQIDQKTNKYLQQAKTKGVNLIDNSQNLKKYDENMKKFQNIKIYKSKTQNLMKTKAQFVIHQNEQSKLYLKGLQTSIESSMICSQDTQAETRKIIQKAKRNSRANPNLIETLDKIFTEMEFLPTLRDVREKEDTYNLPRSTQKKYNSQKNVQKVNTSLKHQQKSQDDSVIKKPVLFKRKEKQQEKKDQRVWKDDRNLTENRKSEPSFVGKVNQNEIKFEQKETPTKEKNKPFTIKRYKDSKHESEPVQVKKKTEPQEPKQEVKEEQNTPSIAPRMMKFKKREKAEETQKNNIPEVQPPKIQTPKQKVIDPKQQDQKPIFAPKRMNLRARGEKKNQESGYLATKMQKSEQLIQQAKKQPIQLPVERKQPQVQQKPKFNLKLRSQQKNQQKIEDNSIKENNQAINKISVNLSDNIQEKNEIKIQPKENTNPYAQQLAENPRKRQRQGPLKKPKVQPSEQPKYNIYDQAQDLINVKEISLDNKSPSPVISKQPQEEIDLNKMLGVQKKKPTIEEDLIIGQEIGIKKGKKQKKDKNFFDDLEL